MKTAHIPATAFVLCVAALHLGAFFLPPSLAWGMHFLGFSGPAFIALYGVGLIVLVIAAFRGGFEGVVGFLGRAASRPLVMPVASLAVFVALGWIFRVEVPLLGDSWYLVQNFAGALRGVDEVLPRDEPLATWYLSGVLGLLGVRTYNEFLRAFFAGQMFLGALFVVIAFATTRLLFADPRRRAIAFLAAFTLPAAVLFFGYVETYAAVLLMVSVFVLAGLLHLRGRIGFWPVAVAFLAMALTHYLTVITFPALAWIAWLDLKAKRGREVAIGTGLVGILVLGILAAVGFDVSNYFSQVPHRHYLPLFTPESAAERMSSAYTLLSPFHFLDLANLAALLVPTALGVAIVGLTRPRDAVLPAPGSRAASRETGFLLAAIVPALLFAFVAKFDLGAARDWDVLAPFSYVALLLAFTWAFGRDPGERATLGAAIVTASGLLHAMLWWGVTGSDAAAVARFRSLMDVRLMSQGGMYSANLYLSRYFRQTTRDDREAAELWLRYIYLYPGDIRGFRNVLINTRSEGAASAADKLRGWARAFAADSLTPRAMAELAVESGNAALEANALDDAETFYRAAIDVDARSAAAWNNLGTVQARRERFGEAAEMFSRAVEYDPVFADAWFNLGRTWLATGQVADARRAIEEAARLGNRAAISLLSTGTVQP